MTMLRPLAWCLGLGTAATVLTVGTGGAGAPFAAALVGGLTGGAAGNFGHEVCKVLDRRVVGKLLEDRSGFAENHVVAQALRLAQVKGLGAGVGRFDAAEADPGNAGWQRDLSVSYNKIGDVQVEQGDLAAALASYRASLAIAEGLAE